MCFFNLSSTKLKNQDNIKATELAQNLKPIDMKDT